MLYNFKFPASAITFCGVLGFLFLGACGSSEKAVPAKSAPDLSRYISASRVEQELNFLSSDELQGREAGSEGIRKAADFIATEFEAYGLAPFFNDFRDTLTNFQPAAYNIVGLVPGTNPALASEPIVVGAHYDHIGVLQGVQGDAIANGANDNATGTVTVMELARYFGNYRTNERPILFALFSAEEKGLLGSRHLAEKLQEQGISPYLVLNYEMTGIPLQNKDYVVYMTGYEMSSLAEVMNDMAGEKVVGFLPQAKEYNLFKRSDNFPFYEVFKLPAHTFSTFDFTNFDHYHQPGDEADLMDAEHMAMVIRKMIPLIEKLAVGGQKVTLN